MWILTKKLHTSAYVPDTKELGLDLEAFCQTCEKSLTWRGKDSLSRTWLQRWKRESWIQHLSSRTLRPSLTESFVDAWTSSLADSRVSHSQLLESVKLLKTPDTSSPTSQKELESANLELFSLKTYKESSVAKPGTENQFSNMSSEHWKDWVIEQRQEYSQRKKSARLIRESESSSWPTATVFDTTGGSYPTEMVDGVYRSKHSQEPNSPWYGAKLKDAVETHEENWATPIANDAKGSDYAGTKENPKALYLGGQVKSWQTPTTMDIERTPEGMEKRKAYRESIGRKYVEGCLTEQVKNWPTPAARDYKGSYRPESRIRKDGKSRMDALPQCVEYDQTTWPTPTVQEGGKIGNKANYGQKGLSNHPAIVGLPSRGKLNKSGKSQGSQQWPTPRANKVHPVITEENREQLANRKKANLEEEIAGHCGRAQGKLNPDWVESLMGLPTGWTDLGSWATE